MTGTWRCMAAQTPLVSVVRTGSSVTFGKERPWNGHGIEGSDDIVLQYGVVIHASRVLIVDQQYLVPGTQEQGGMQAKGSNG